jgi:hypothetical protein
MFGVNQHFSKHCSVHFQGGYVVGEFWRPYIGQAVSGEIDLMGLIGGAEEQAAIQWERSMWLRKGGGGILRGRKPKLYIELQQ